MAAGWVGAGASEQAPAEPATPTARSATKTRVRIRCSPSIGFVSRNDLRNCVTDTRPHAGFDSSSYQPADDCANRMPENDEKANPAAPYSARMANQSGPG